LRTFDHARAVFARICRHFTLEQRYKGTSLPTALEERTDLDPAFIRAIVRGGLNGMPRARKTELSDDELAAIGAYLNRPRR